MLNGRHRHTSKPRMTVAKLWPSWGSCQWAIQSNKWKYRQIDNGCGREGSKWTAAAEKWFSYTVVTGNCHGNYQSPRLCPLCALCIIVEWSMRNKINENYAKLLELLVFSTCCHIFSLKSTLKGIRNLFFFRYQTYTVIQVWGQIFGGRFFLKERN